jgi:hypothetical protein
VERLPLALHSPPLPALVSDLLLPLLLLPSVLLPPIRLHPLAALLGMRQMPGCFRLSLLLGSLLTCAIGAGVLSAAAQTPMSPIFPTLPSKSGQPSASKPVAPAPVLPATTPSHAVARSERDDPVVATAVIPPPLPEAHTDETAKPGAGPPKAESKAAAQPTAKRERRAVRRRQHYGRRYYGPWYPSPAYATATLSGWGFGRFGPAPNSSTGQ